MNDGTVILRLEGAIGMNQSQAATVRGLRGHRAQGWHVARSALLVFITLSTYGALGGMPEAARPGALSVAAAEQVASGAVVQVHELPGMTRAMYDQAISAMGLPG